MYCETLIRVGDNQIYGRIINYLNINCKSIPDIRKHLESEEFRQPRQNVEVEKVANDILERIKIWGNRADRILSNPIGSQNYNEKALCCMISQKTNKVISKVWVENDIIRKIISGKHYPGLYACFLRYPNLPIGH
jgi:hypothetical protein